VNNKVGTGLLELARTHWSLTNVPLSLAEWRFIKRSYAELGAAFAQHLGRRGSRQINSRSVGIAREVARAQEAQSSFAGRREHLQEGRIIRDSASEARAARQGRQEELCSGRAVCRQLCCGTILLPIAC